MKLFGRQVRLEWVLLALGLALTLTYEAWGIGAPGLWQDEASTISGASRGPLALMALSSTVDAVHSLYYFGMSVWGLVFGYSPFSVRFPSALAVTAAVAVTYLVGRRIGGKRLAAIAAVILAVMPRMTWAASEARSYGFTSLAGALLFWLFLKANEVEVSDAPANIKRRWWWFFASVSALASYIFLFALLLLLAGFITLAVRRAGRQHLRTYLKFGGISVAFSSIIIVFGFFERGQISWIADTTWKNLFTQIIDAPLGHGTKIEGAVGLLLGLAVLALLVRPAARARFATAFKSIEFQHLVITVLVPMVILLGVSLAGHKIYNARYVTFLMPAVALLVGWIFATALPWPLLIVAALAAVTISIPAHDLQRAEFGKGTDWGVVARTIQPQIKPGDALIEAGTKEKPPWLRRIKVAYLAEFKGTHDVTEKYPYYDHFILFPDPSTPAVIQERLRHENRAWLIFSDTKPFLDGKIESKYLSRAGLKPGPIQYFRHTRLQLWTR